jgi:hypothetical protein
MESFDDIFAAELRALRPAPRPAFAAELDERAADGFPRRPEQGGDAPLARLRVWFEELTPRRALVPGGAAALVVVVIVTAIVAISQSGSTDTQLSLDTSGTSQSSGAIEEAGGGGAEIARPAGKTRSSHQAAPSSQGAPSSPNKSAEAGAVESKASELPSYEVEVPTAPQAGGGAAAGAGAVSTPSLSSARNRDVERSASIVLGTPPNKLSEASARVYEAVHAANGIVLHSSIHSGAHNGGATFDLLIPSGKLNDALAAFSGIAEVRSRHDATTDITAPTISVSEELQDSNARIEGLVAQLGEAESDAEREAVEAELRGERNHHGALRASLERLKDRAGMSRVSLRIVSGHGAGITPGGDSGSWGVGDALHDAGHILTVAGGVAIIGLAVLGPIALILLAFWLVNRLRVRRLRERTLG